METDKPLPIGSYIEGDSPLHRLDPRWKVLVCIGLVAAAFSAAGWRQLAVAVLAALFLLISGGQGAGLIFRLLWPFRYLFLFTVLLHTLLSPGYTLFGSTWLSRDGLLLGARTCTQVAVALLGASLLALTTRPDALARSCGWFLGPLRWLGCKVDEWEGLMLLTLRFIPVMRERLAETLSDSEEPGPERKGASRRLRFEVWESRLVTLLDRLVEQADQMAHRVATGEEHLGQSLRLGPMRAVTSAEVFFILSATLLTLSYLFVGVA